MGKAIKIGEDFQGTGGDDPSKVVEIYQVVDDNGFQHTVRVDKDSTKKPEDIISEVGKNFEGKEVIDLGAVDGGVIPA